MTYLKEDLEKLEFGNELEIKTKDGGMFKGILFDIREGYLHTVIQMGILAVIPIQALLHVTKI